MNKVHAKIFVFLIRSNATQCIVQVQALLFQYFWSSNKESAQGLHDTIESENF